MNLCDTLPAFMREWAQFVRDQAERRPGGRIGVWPDPRRAGVDVVPHGDPRAAQLGARDEA